MTPEPPTDPAFLACMVYADPGRLAARQGIYAYGAARRPFPEWALDQIGWEGVRRVVDVGCGNGVYLRRLAERASVDAVVGVDLSLGMLAGVVGAWSEAVALPRLVVGDVTRLPLRDACADVVLAMHMLYHAADLDRAVGQLRRILASGGRLLVATNGADHLAEIDALYAETMRAVGGVHDERDRWASRFDLDGGRRLLARHFAAVETRPRRDVLTIPVADPVVAYLDSLRGHVESRLPASITWDDFLTEARARVTALLADRPFRVHASAGVFVCR